MMRASLVKVVPLVLLGACTWLNDPGPQVVTMRLAHNTVTCHDWWGETQCMLAQEDGGPWRSFLDEITGFSYEPGFVYELRTEKRPVTNPPADGSSVEYVLRSVVLKKPCAASAASLSEPPESCF